VEGKGTVDLKQGQSFGDECRCFKHEITGVLCVIGRVQNPDQSKSLYDPLKRAEAQVKYPKDTDSLEEISNIAHLLQGCALLRVRLLYQRLFSDGVPEIETPSHLPSPFFCHFPDQQ
jgi:hypothetical protein